MCVTASVWIVWVLVHVHVCECEWGIYVQSKSNQHNAMTYIRSVSHTYCNHTTHSLTYTLTLPRMLSDPHSLPLSQSHGPTCTHTHSHARCRSGCECECTHARPMSSTLDTSQLNMSTSYDCYVWHVTFRMKCNIIIKKKRTIARALNAKDKAKQ